MTMLKNVVNPLPTKGAGKSKANPWRKRQILRLVRTENLLGDALRIGGYIIAKLKSEDGSVDCSRGQLAEELHIRSANNVSRAISLLKERRILLVDKVGPKNRYRVTPTKKPKPKAKTG